MTVPIEVIPACSMARTWYVAEGHVPKKQVRGAVLAEYRYDYPTLEPLWRGKLVQGWRATKLEAGDGEWCEPGDPVSYFYPDRPEGDEWVSIEPVTYLEVEL